MKLLVVTLVILAVITGLGVAAYLNAGRIGVAIVSAANGLDISYTGLTHDGFRSYDFTGLTLTDRKTGSGLTAKRALVEPVLQDLFAGAMTAEISMAEVSFVGGRKGADEELDTIEGLVHLPFQSGWQYSSVTGRIRTEKDAISAQDLLITGDTIKLRVSGTFKEDASIDADITIYFADVLLKKIPEDMIRMVLKDEGDGWRSFQVRLHGNYKKPSIQVTGRQFRLSIGTAVAS